MSVTVVQVGTVAAGHRGAGIVNVKLFCVFLVVTPLLSLFLVVVVAIVLIIITAGRFSASTMLGKHLARRSRR